MPLTAITHDRGIVIADDMDESDRAENYFFCRHCGSEMRLVIPYVGHRVKFFRHLPGESCAYSGESRQHLEAKMFFYNKYKNDPNYEKVEVEGVLEFDDNDGNHIKRIGDVVLYPKDKSMKPTVIEVQRSNISTDEIIARFDDWNDVHDNRGKYKFYKGMRNGKKTTLYNYIKNVYSMLWVYVAIDDVSNIPKWAMSLRYIYGGRLYVFFDGVLYDMRFDRGFHGYSSAVRRSNMIEIRDFDIFQKDVIKNSYYTKNVNKHFYISYFNDYITGDHGKISIMYTHSNKLSSNRDKMLSLAFTKVLILRNKGIDVESLVYNELLRYVNYDDYDDSIYIFPMNFVGTVIKAKYPCKCNICKKSKKSIESSGQNFKPALHIRIKPLTVYDEVQHEFFVPLRSSVSKWRSLITRLDKLGLINNMDLRKNIVGKTFEFESTMVKVGPIGDEVLCWLPVKILTNKEVDEFVKLDNMYNALYKY